MNFPIYQIFDIYNFILLYSNSIQYIYIDYKRKYIGIYSERINSIFVWITYIKIEMSFKKIYVFSYKNKHIILYLFDIKFYISKLYLTFWQRLCEYMY